jgi:hypothetical protein
MTRAQLRAERSRVHARALRLTAAGALVLIFTAVWLFSGIGRTPTASEEQATVIGSSTGAISMAGVDNFAWTIGGALARGAQPPPAAWSELRASGITTVIRQSAEGGPAAEEYLVRRAGLRYVGDFAVLDNTAYSPPMLEGMLTDVVGRLRRGERILVHDSGGRGRMGFWEATFLMWDGWSARDAIDRYVAFGWKIDCDKGGNGQMQAINEIALVLGQPSYYPDRDSWGTPWPSCPRPAYMEGWDYASIRWPTGGGALWSRSGWVPTDGSPDVAAPG